MLTELIITGELKPAQYLPSEHELCARYGTSRTAVREALKTLQASGLIEVRHGVGAVVTPDNSRAVADAMLLLLRRNMDIFDDLLEIRGMLEVEAAKLASRHAGEADIDALERTLEEMRKPDLTVDRYIEVDMEFHSLLAAATKNRLLPAVLRPVQELLRATRRLLFEQHLGVVTVVEHEEIVRRIRSREAAGAGEAMHHHLSEVAKRCQAARRGRTQGEIVHAGSLS